MPLSSFHPAVSQWFSETLGAPTVAQSRGWQAIRERQHTLIAAPTGSGKTLAAFLTALDELFVEGLVSPLPDEVRVVYVSPLKALSADIHKNLAEPRRGIRQVAERMGVEAPRITAAVRTGDTTSSERAAMLKTPPHILVTTPESLYLLLTAERSREMLRTVTTVIVDEIHAVIGTRRGAHLALTLERLQQAANQPLLRIGLSATQKPIEEVARYLVGVAERRLPAGVVTGWNTEPGGDERDAELQSSQPVTTAVGNRRSTSPAGSRRSVAVAIVNEGHRREMDLGLEIPRSLLETVMSHEVWEEYYERLTSLINEHKTTLIFVNTRRMAERVARHLSDRLGEEAVTAHHGSLSKEKRLDAETRLKNGELKALVATASLELGIDIGHVDLVCQIGSPHRIATLLQRVGRSGHTISGLPKGRVFPTSRDDLVECASLLRAVRRGELDRIVSHEAPLDVLAQQLVAESACFDYAEDDLFEVVKDAWPYRDLERSSFDSVLEMVAEGYATKRGRRGALVHRDEVNRNVRGRRGSRMLAITSGGAIPELADYRVILEPDETFVGTLNEDFAIESNAGDIFQLGNASWQITQVTSGVVRVVDAHGAPPTIPFWLGEAPARSDELSRAVSDVRSEVDVMLAEETSEESIISWLITECGIPRGAATEIYNYLAEGRRALGVLPTQETLVLERFFDESGGMQLVLHAPFGSRVNKAWGLALRKRFCRQFNFELQAAATEDAVLLSLGPQHSFPLADVFRYLHPNTSRDVLVQAFLDAPVFQTRWRWNTTISLAIPRNRGGRRIPPQLQRSMADDLMAAVFPDAAACLENVAGDRKLPDHPLVNQAVRDCLEEAMDFQALSSVLARIHSGDLRCVARDTTEPSTLSHAILNAAPYAFLDDAPLEERRTQAVYTRRAGDTKGNDLGALDLAAIERVRDEVRPDPRDADELHDILLTTGFLSEGDAAEIDRQLFDQLVAARRAGRVTPDSGAAVWVAAERLPELLALHPHGVLEHDFTAPPSRAARNWTREEAATELIRGRLSITGPTTAGALANSFSITEREVDAALVMLEAEGVVLRGVFLPRGPGVAAEIEPDPRAGHGARAPLEWCDRRLLSRIHRYTLNRLRSEIDPVSASDFMRFLFSWQHVSRNARLTGVDGVQEVIAQLDGFEVAADAWEKSILPARIESYESADLDMLCLAGEVGWARLSDASVSDSDSLSRLIGATPTAMFLHENAAAWQKLRLGDETVTHEALPLSDAARQIAAMLATRRASFAKQIATVCGLEEEETRHAIGELVSAGLITSDGFAGLRSIVKSGARAPRPARSNGTRSDFSGRWSLIDRPDDISRDAAVECQARALLRRYGVVFRKLLTREINAAPWRELARVYRRLEARGEIRGGRFVHGMSGEQFALAEAVTRLREIRKEGPDGQIVVVSAVDPLNLVGIITPGERVRSVDATHIAYRDGVPLSLMEGEYLRPLAEMDDSSAHAAANALAGRSLPVTSGYVGRRTAPLR